MPAPRLPVLLLAAALAAPPLAAQHRAAPLPTLAAPVLLAQAAPGAAWTDAREGGDLPLLAASGLVAGAAGALGGALAGLVASCTGREDENESCYLNSWLWGAAIGESLAMPVGVHLANGRRGSLGLSLLASAGLGALGLALLEETHYDPPGAVLVSTAIPLAQLAATIAVERATSR
ncbi:MAG TPA: hypothetical protein VF263_10360 [Longimicrobiaceae bacterium]